MYGLVGVVSCVFVVWICGSICYGILSLSSSFSFSFIFCTKHFILYIFWLLCSFVARPCVAASPSLELWVLFLHIMLVCIFIALFLHLSLSLSISFWGFCGCFCMLNFYERDVRSRDSCVWSFKVFRIWKFISCVCCFLPNLIYIIHSWIIFVICCWLLYSGFVFSL